MFSPLKRLTMYRFYWVWITHLTLNIKLFNLHLWFSTTFFTKIFKHMKMWRKIWDIDKVFYILVNVNLHGNLNYFKRRKRSQVTEENFHAQGICLWSTVEETRSRWPGRLNEAIKRSPACVTEERVSNEVKK